MKSHVLAVLLCTASLLPARGSDNLWVGVWRLDPARSHFVGTTFTYSQTADGMYHYSEGPKSTYTSFRIDGHEYKTDGTSTSTWTAVGDNAWDTIHRTRGAVVEHVHRQLSSDRNTFSMTANGTLPDGTPTHDTVVYRRSTAGTGLLGRWISTKTESSAPFTIVILPSPAGTYHWEAPAYKAALEGRLDGSDIVITGPQVSPGSTATYRRITSHRIVHSLKVNGIAFSVGVQTLARDGRSFTDVTWVPGKRYERSIGVFIKQ